MLRASLPDIDTPAGSKSMTRSSTGSGWSGVLALAACALLAGATSGLAVGEWIADAPPHVLQRLGVRIDPLFALDQAVGRCWPAGAAAAAADRAGSRSTGKVCVARPGPRAARPTRYLLPAAAGDRDRPGGRGGEQRRDAHMIKKRTSHNYAEALVASAISLLEARGSRRSGKR